MKRTLSMLMATVLVASLSSCSTADNLWAKDDGPELARAQFARIIEAINSGDADALKGEFSATAVADDENLDSEIARLFELLPDGVWSWRRCLGSSSGGSHEPGKSSAYVYCGNDIVLDSPTPVSLWFDLYLYNTIDPDNVGVYALSVTTAEDDVAWEGPGLFVSESLPIVGGRP